MVRADPTEDVEQTPGDERRARARQTDLARVAHDPLGTGGVMPSGVLGKYECTRVCHLKRPVSSKFSNASTVREGLGGPAQGTAAS